MIGYVFGSIAFIVVFVIGFFVMLRKITKKVDVNSLNIQALNSLIEYHDQTLVNWLNEEKLVKIQKKEIIRRRLYATLKLDEAENTAC